MKASEALKAILDHIMVEGDCEIMIAQGAKSNLKISDITQGYDETLVSAGETASRRILRITQV